MAIKKPYRRTCRQFLDGHYSEGGRWRYITHPKFAQSPDQYVRSFFLLQKDLKELFDYIEPSDTNLKCYSYRVHELLMRACIEVEANCRAILLENDYKKDTDLNMDDYKKIEKTHLLSEYEVKVPYWHGEKQFRRPFFAWSTIKALPWYRAYNATKHDRYESFMEATFDNLIDACCGVLVLLSAQFHTIDFAPGNSPLALEGPNDGMESGIGEYFRVKFPNNWPEELRYDFNWKDLENEDNPFQSLDFS